MTIEGERQSAVQSGTLRRLEAEWQLSLPPPTATSPELLQHCGVLVAGIGGTGIVTVGAILAMAAHLEGRGASTLDFTGLAQKNGAVVSHVQLAQSPAHIATARIEPKSANLLLGCDAVVSASPDVLARLRPGAAHAVVETAMTPTADLSAMAICRFHCRLIGMRLNVCLVKAGRNSMTGAPRRRQFSATPSRLP
ncbi:hypothetical protein AWV80_29435 [Cupriavidus sp. UYMU48A]|nr:hypothetical protein AWV80_29435 [Cupriavidus sp. UYMU48A]